MRWFLKDSFQNKSASFAREHCVKLRLNSNLTSVHVISNWILIFIENGLELLNGLSMVIFSLYVVLFMEICVVIENQTTK